MEQNFVNKEIKKIDKWIHYCVYHTWVKTGVFVIAFLEATISPILPEVIVAGILTYRKDISWKLLSVISALGSTAGVATLYLVGKYLYRTHQVFLDSFFSGSLIATYTERVLDQNTFITMFIAAFTPLPDRVFAFLSGVFSLQFFVVLLAFFLGRLVRVGIVAYFSSRFGDTAKQYILKHIKNVTITIIIVCMLYILLKISAIL